MARVITFSHQFPSYHPREGEPTLFVEQVLNSLDINFRSPDYLELLTVLNLKNISDGKLLNRDLVKFHESLDKDALGEKIHTVRGGCRWKQGNMFSPRVWSGKPYNSPQIIFAPDQEVKETHAFDIRKNHLFGYAPFLNNQLISPEKLFTVANNDGLGRIDFQNWFRWGKQEFYGQVICWVDPKY